MIGLIDQVKHDGAWAEGRVECGAAGTQSRRGWEDGAGLDGGPAASEAAAGLPRECQQAVGEVAEPKPTRGFYHALGDVAPDKTFVVYAGDERYLLSEGIDALGLSEAYGLDWGAELSL